MNKRIRKKVYKRAEEKLFAAARKPGETRSIQQIAREDNILSPLEYKAFNDVQRKMWVVFKEIKDELISEGKW